MLKLSSALEYHLRSTQDIKHTLELIWKITRYFRQSLMEQDNKKLLINSDAIANCQQQQNK